jgi:hypothetical protein
MNRAIKVSSVVAALLVAFALAPAPALAAGGKGTVKGKVVKADGSPVADATVQLMARAAGGRAAAEPKAQNPADPSARPAAKERAKPESVAQTTTNAQGEFTLSDVAEGQYAVVARLKKEGNARERVTVHAGQTANVTLTLRARGEGNAKPGANNNTTRAERKRARLERKHETAAQQQQQQAATPQQ